MKARRLPAQIYLEILTWIKYNANTKHERIKPTKIQLATKLSYDKVKQHTTKMVTLGLIDSKYNITEKGEEYLMNSEIIIDDLKNLENYYLTKENPNSKFVLNVKPRPIPFSPEWERNQKQLVNILEAIIEHYEGSQPMDKKRPHMQWNPKRFEMPEIDYGAMIFTGIETTCSICHKPIIKGDNIGLQHNETTSEIVHLLCLNDTLPSKPLETKNPLFTNPDEVWKNPICIRCNKQIKISEKVVYDEKNGKPGMCHEDCKKLYRAKP